MFLRIFDPPGPGLIDGHIFTHGVHTSASVRHKKHVTTLLLVLKQKQTTMLHGAWWVTNSPDLFIFFFSSLCKFFSSRFLHLVLFWAKHFHAISVLTHVRSENKSGDFRVTHQATANNRWSLFSCMVSFVARFHFVTDGRTDTMCENNDHLFGRGLVGQKNLTR